jgi:uncharacterized protein DUF4157
MFAYVEKTRTQSLATSNNTLARQHAAISVPPVGNRATRRTTGIPPVVHRVLNSSGHSLDASARAFFEPRFGHDFSRVRVHTDSLAAASAKAVDARAYVVGSHLVFDSDQYSPGTAEGRKLLAHELSHVVQQRPNASTRPERISQPGDRAETAADKVAENVSSSSPSLPALDSPAPAEATLARYTVPSSLKCPDVAPWLDANSPYKPEWAQTSCDYSFNGDLDVTPPKKVGGNVSLTAKGNKKVSVSVNCSTDLPEWSPSGQADQQAWAAMIAILDAHEGRHRALGQTWRGTLETRYQGVNLTATGADEADARTNLQTKLDSTKDGWGKEAQAAQSKLDPFRGAVLNCPAVNVPSGPPSKPANPAPSRPDAGASKDN